MPIRQLCLELQRKSVSELNENPGRIHEDLKHIQNWMTQQPHLNNIRTDDQWLLSFLRGCKFSLERTKEKLDNFYAMRTLIPEFFSNRDPFLPAIQKVLEYGVVLPLPRTVTPDGPRIILCRIPLDPFQLDLPAVHKTAFMVLEILMNEDDNFVIAGQHGVAETQNFSLKHGVQATPAFARKVVYCMQNAYPIRPKGFHTINTPAIFEMMFNMTKPLLTEKLKKRMKVYGPEDMNLLYENIPQFVFPIEYGGETGTISELAAYWKEKVESYREWFIEEAKYYSDEALRPEKSQHVEEIFGIDGSFRQIDID